MKCRRVNCNTEIPKGRKKTAKYCSHVCYYETKKERSSKHYHFLKSVNSELNRCEEILSYLHGVKSLNKSISADDLQKLKFNFSVATNEHLDDQKRVFRVVGAFGYHISSSKELTIWKFKLNH
jgi:hypothetical protein